MINCIVLKSRTNNIHDTLEVWKNVRVQSIPIKGNNSRPENYGNSFWCLLYINDLVTATSNPMYSLGDNITFLSSSLAPLFLTAVQYTKKTTNLA